MMGKQEKWVLETKGYQLSIALNNKVIHWNQQKNADM